jgi:glutamate-1-semialdehyde 2,1-aminomutase
MRKRIPEADMGEPRFANMTLGDALEDARGGYLASTTRSRASFEAACAHMPGGNTRTVLFYSPYPAVLVRGEGAYLWDLDGNRYTDFAGEYSAGLYGHSNSVIRAAIEEALSAGTVLGGPNRYEGLFAAAVCRRFPSIELVRFVNSGTEANLMALGTARAVTGREKILAFDGAYHGGVLTFTGKPGAVNAPFPVILARFNDAEQVCSIVEREGDQLAAVIIEPMMGAAGCIPADPEFLSTLRAATERTGTLLIFDEVMTSRLSPGGLQGKLGINPDLTTLGKYLGGGLSSGAFGGRRDIMARYDPRRSDMIGHAGTFNNNVCSLAGGLAGLTHVFTPEEAVRLNADGDRLRERLNMAARERGLPVQFTGIGSLMNIHFSSRTIRSPADLADTPALRELWHLDMLASGQYLHRRGYICLSLPMTPVDLDGLVDATCEFLDQRGRIIAS